MDGQFGLTNKSNTMFTNDKIKKIIGMSTITRNQIIGEIKRTNRNFSVLKWLLGPYIT